MMFCLGVCGSARDRRVGSWNRRNGEQYSCRAEVVGRCGRLRRAMARQENKSKKEIEKVFFKNVTAVVSAEAVCDRG